MTLDQYFHLIINKPRIVEFKETSMFEYLKNKWSELMTTRYSFVEPETIEEGYEEGRAFVMRTDSYVNEDGEFIPMKETIIQGDNNGTWMESLDQLLDVFSEHYGYNIKEQVYYSVNFPLNDTDDKGTPFPGYGRCLNDERLQQILLAFPELYVSGGWSNSPEREAMFK